MSRVDLLRRAGAAPAMTDVLVIGAGPAGVYAAQRAAELGARTTLVTREEFGGMAANEGTVPVRTLAHAARLIREARQLGRYGIAAVEPALDYSRLLARVREVVEDVRAHSAFRPQIERLGVAVHERAGAARFSGSHEVETESGLRLRADRIILCTGGTSRRLAVPGFEWTSTHQDVWGLTSVPPSMLVVGAGATGVQVASIFNAFGSRVAALPERPAHPADGGRRRLGGRRRGIPRVGRCGARRTWIESTPSRRRHPASG